MILTLIRDSQNDVRTLGHIVDGMGIILVAATLELPWKDNQPDISCVPVGTYDCKLEYSPVHKKDLYWLQHVKDRGAVEIHIGNFPRDTHGCILLGSAIGADTASIENSTSAFYTFMNFLNGAPDFTLIIQ